MFPVVTRRTAVQDRASFTAETVALMRALETHRGPGRRLFSDPHAEPFTRGRLRVLARCSRVPGIGGVAAWAYDCVAGPGPRPSAVARTRFIDDVVTGRAPGVDQLVLLGAGFDTRAHRLPALAGVTTFEVDHPATQARKIAIVAGEGLDARGVVYVPVDFERDRLDDALVASGFDPARPAVFVWEGVTNYLTATAVDATLATLRELAAPGSTLVVTYVHSGVLDGTATFREAGRWVHNVERAGEPWTFGLDPGEVPAFLRARGFDLVVDVSTRQADRGRFAALGRRERGSELYHVVVAEAA
jgi:methyltransferase (TIGR00027 family)